MRSALNFSVTTPEFLVFPVNLSLPFLIARFLIICMGVLYCSWNPSSAKRVKMEENKGLFCVVLNGRVLLNGNRVFTVFVR